MQDALGTLCRVQILSFLRVSNFELRVSGVRNQRLRIPSRVAFRLFDLNEPQMRAVRQTEGPVLILAGAGTGKTRTITARIAFLIANGAAPSSILAVTFTNKAAEEMRERVAGMVPAEQAQQVTVSTFHALCVRILRQDIEKLGYKKNFAIYDQSDAISLVRQIITRVAARDEKLEPNAAQGLISRAKNLGIEAPTDENAEKTVAGAVFSRYQRELKRLNAVDFDDLLLLAVRLLREHEDVRAKWAERYRYLMVDEFQDTNGLQLDLIRRLASGERPNVCVVGDDDQSIYGWRGAEVRNILEFERYFPNPTVIALEQNYRSTDHILGLANSLIRHNPRRRAKQLWSGKGAGEKIRLVAAPDDREEAAYVVGDLHRLNFEAGLPFDDAAVLFRTNAQSRLIEEGLRERGIPYRVVGGQSFFDRREVKDVIAYLRLLLNPADDVSLLRIINAPPRGIGETTVERALAFSIERKINLYAALGHPDFAATVSAKTRTAIGAFVVLLDRFAERIFAPLADRAAVARAFLDESGFVADLRRSCKNAEEADRREESVFDLLQDLGRYQGAAGEKGLRDFIDRLSLESDREEETPEGQHGVTLITLHAAKGLEFPHVYVLGLEEGLLPHERSRSDGTIDEERRLLYVAITRAKERLTLTHCRTRFRYGHALPRQPSSFLRELDAAHLELVDFARELAKPATEQAAKSSFARMREMLGN
jgi:DNA helicase II / ATP-dependent DNA helicase PcrA